MYFFLCLLLATCLTLHIPATYAQDDDERLIGWKGEVEHVGQFSKNNHAATTETEPW